MESFQRSVALSDKPHDKRGACAHALIMGHPVPGSSAALGAMLKRKSNYGDSGLRQNDDSQITVRPDNSQLTTEN